MTEKVKDVLLGKAYWRDQAKSRLKKLTNQSLASKSTAISLNLLLHLQKNFQQFIPHEDGYASLDQDQDQDKDQDQWQKFTLGGFAPLIGEEPQWMQGVFWLMQNNMSFPFFYLSSSSDHHHHHHHKTESGTEEKNHGEKTMQFYSCGYHQLETLKKWGKEFRLPPSHLVKKMRPVTPDLLLVPGLLFSSKGERLGRGQGYYDRYLKNFPGKKWALCFEEQLCDDQEFSQIVEEHDELVDVIITEKRIITVN